MQEFPRLYKKQEGTVRLCFYAAFVLHVCLQILQKLNQQPQRLDKENPCQIKRELKCFQKVKRFYKENPTFIGNRHDIAIQIIKAQNPVGYISGLFYTNILNKVTWVCQMLKKHRNDFSKMTRKEYHKLPHTKPSISCNYRRARSTDVGHKTSPQSLSKQEQKIWLDQVKISDDGMVYIDDFFFRYPNKCFTAPKYPPKKVQIISSFKIKIQNISLINFKYSFPGAWKFPLNKNQIEGICESVNYMQVTQPNSYMKKKYGKNQQVKVSTKVDQKLIVNQIPQFEEQISSLPEFQINYQSGSNIFIRQEEEDYIQEEEEEEEEEVIQEEEEEEVIQEEEEEFE